MYFFIAIFLKFGSFGGNDVHWNIVGLYFGGCLCFDFEISTKVPTDIYRIDTIQRGNILLYICLVPVKPEVHQLTSCQTGSALKEKNMEQIFQEQVRERDITLGFGIDIQTPMEDFSKQQEIEREMSYYELFQRLMNGNHSAQMVKKN